MPYLAALEQALFGVGMPYGYTLTVWSAGAMVIASHGTPSVGDVLLLAGGAIAAYGTLQLLSRRAEEPTKRQLGASPRPIRAGAIHISAIGLAIGAAALVSLIGAWAAWPLAGFAATATYLLVLAVELALQERERNDER
jgi:hypothetical protein